MPIEHRNASGWDETVIAIEGLRRMITLVHGRNLEHVLPAAMRTSNVPGLWAHIGNNVPYTMPSGSTKMGARDHWIACSLTRKIRAAAWDGARELGLDDELPDHPELLVARLAADHLERSHFRRREPS